MLEVVILLIGIAILLLLIAVVKLNAFTSLIITAIGIGLANGLQTTQIINALTKGIGDILGSVLMVLGFGVMLGSILTETGATKKISNKLLQAFGVKNAKLALCITSFCVGLALFYNAGFIVLIPLVFAVAYQTGLPLIYLAIAMAAPLSITHGFLPPHPGPTAIAHIFEANTGKTLLYGLVIAIPVLMLAGLIFPEFIKRIHTKPPPGIFDEPEADTGNLPQFGISLLVALVPVILLAVSTLLLHMVSPAYTAIKPFLMFIGDPGISLLIAVIMAVIFLGVVRGIRVGILMNKSALAVNAIASIVLITAAGGALKQILIESGTGNAITNYFQNSAMPPLLLGWIIATVLRIAIGSATVAGLTAAGIVQPLVAALHISPELMVLSIGAGSLMCSHVNDTGFWMFKEYLGLSLKNTFKTWTVMESIIGIGGLAGVMLLNIFIGG